MNDRYSPISRCKWLLTVLLLTYLPAPHSVRQSSFIPPARANRLKQQVQAMGGTFRYEFKNLNAVSAVVPTKSMPALAAAPGIKLRKSLPVRIPSTGHSGIVTKAPAKIRISGKMKMDRADVLKSITSRPADYLFNNALINANLGDGVVVAVIDTTRASPTMAT